MAKTNEKQPAAEGGGQQEAAEQQQNVNPKMEPVKTDPAALEGKPLIYQRMVGVLRDIDAVAKARKNTEQNYQYRGAEDLLNAMHPVLAKHGVFVIPGFETLEYKEGTSKKGTPYTDAQIVATYQFTTEDGSSVMVRIPGQALDYGDKSVYKALTMTLKYALATTFCVPFADLHEGDDESIEKGEVLTQATAQAKAQQPPRVSDEEVKLTIEKAKQEGSLKPLIALYNKMPSDQQEESKDMLGEARSEIKAAEKPVESAKNGGQGNG